MKQLIVIILSVFTLYSCGTTKTLSPAEVKLMSTKQYDADYDMVFASAMSLIQSEGFLVENTDKSSGLINASKQIDNKNAGWQMALIGTATESSNAKLAIFVENINPELTEVRLTIYEGSQSSSLGTWGSKNTTSKNSMVQKPEVYTSWFNNLRAEIERRKALRN